MKTTIVIVSYNSFSVIENCLGPLIDAGVCPVIVVDNASQDGTAKRVSRRFPNASLIVLNHNVGYGRAANYGFGKVKTDYVLLLNPDMMVSVESFLAIQSRLESLPENVALLAPAVRKKDYIRKGVHDRDWVVGAAMLFRVSAIREVGGFDENIFLFSEESDLCLRLRQAGKRICLDTDVFMEHLSKQSSTPSPDVDFVKYWHFGWSNQYFVSKHGLARGKKNPYRVLLLYFVKSIFAVRFKKRMEYWAKFSGARAFLKGTPAFDETGEAQQAYRLKR
ncbi:glycosyltransferase family 2 protein [uncultured Marinobacter sp.]|uniref:glycosyltransferase family 2 protein n=1 Tax=uncultured Marinobacter sp. TaxID=187379 RepID=UPI00235529E5